MKKTSIQNSNKVTVNFSNLKAFTPILFAFSTFAIAAAPIFVSAQMMTTSAQSSSTQSFQITQADIASSSVASITWPTIEAKSAFIYNPVSNQIIYEKNADIQRPTASLLKIMTAATAEGLLAKAPSLADKKLIIPKMKDEAAVDFSLPTGSTWLPDHLMQIMLLGSSNKAAETIASQLIPRSSFMSLMNFNAKQMGLKQTYFRNPSGLTETSTAVSKSKTTQPASTAEGQLDIAAGVSTAREMAQMMWSIIAQNPGLLDVTNQESLTIAGPKTAKNATGTTIIANTDKILKDFPIVFGKTGFTSNAGGNLAIVMQKDVTSQPYVIVVLGSGFDKRFDDVAKLASTTLQLINLQNPSLASSATTSTSVR